MQKYNIYDKKLRTNTTNYDKYQERTIETNFLYKKVCQLNKKSYLCTRKQANEV